MQLEASFVYANTYIDSKLYRFTLLCYLMINLEFLIFKTNNVVVLDGSYFLHNDNIYI